jgi:hypothetical protein
MVHGKKPQGEGRKMRENELAFWWGLTWKGAGHMENDKWMMRRREDHVDQRGEVDG